MFNKEDKEELKVVAVFGKSFPTIKDENTSPLVINMPEDIDNIDFPEDLLKLEVYEIINSNKKKKTLVRTIYVGEIYTINEMNEICPRFRFSFGMDWASLCNLGHDSPCVFYKNENDVYVQLAVLKAPDIVVSSIQELKELLKELSDNCSLVQLGMSRIRNIPSKKQ